MTRTKRKPIRSTVPDVRESAPRSLEVAVEAKQSYPSANALVASGEAWRAWLDDALRCVLGPAALVGALGVAAAGCTLPGVSLDPFGAAATAAPRVEKPSAPVVAAVTLVPLGPPSSPIAMPTPTPTSVQVEVPPVQPPPPARPLPPRHLPARYPAAMRGGAPAIRLPVRGAPI